MNIFNTGGSTYSYMNSFFGNLNSGSSAKTEMTGSILSDYSAVRNGSYKKLAKKLYSSNTDSGSDVTSVQSAGRLTKAGASNVVKSLGDLMDSRLYEQVEKTDSEGNSTRQYDYDKILDKVKNFVKDYNDTISGAGNLTGKNALRASVRMVGQMNVYQGALARVGISVGSDNKLSLDEDKFKKSEMSDIKSLFTGNVSFAKNIQDKSMQVYRAVTTGRTGNDLYTSSARRNTSTGDLFDTIF